jgi:hypothetical protein
MPPSSLTQHEQGDYPALSRTRNSHHRDYVGMKRFLDIVDWNILHTLIDLLQTGVVHKDIKPVGKHFNKSVSFPFFSVILKDGSQLTVRKSACASPRRSDKRRDRSSPLRSGNTSCPPARRASLFLGHCFISTLWCVRRQNPHV